MTELMLLKVIRQFIEHPYADVYLRELAKKLGISPFSAKKYADMLLKENLIKEERKANLRYFRSNYDSLTFRHIKITYNIYMIEKCGLIKFLVEEVPNISSITLFGSAATGEDDYEKSDIDLLVIGKDNKISTRKFEDALGREINLHVFGWAEWKKMSEENKAFYIDIISHGIQLYGERPIANANKKS